MQNTDFSDEDILRPHIEQTWNRINHLPVVLAIQDSMQCDFSGRPATTGLGVLQDSKHQGFWCHTALAVTPDRIPLGLLHQKCWTREPGDYGKRHVRRQRAIEDKESNKWLEALRATEIHGEKAASTEFIHVADREADIYDFLLLSHELGVQVLVRGNWNRNTTDGKVWDSMAAQSSAGTMTVQIPQQTKRPARIATLEIRFCKLEIEPPLSRRKEKLSPVNVWCVLAWENDGAQPKSPSSRPPKQAIQISDEAQSPGEAKDLESSSGLKGPITWLLYSTRPILNLNDAIQSVKWYSCRWTIEMWHKVLKSGCGIEDRQLRSAERLQRSLAIESVVAARVLSLTMTARVDPESDCSHLFLPYEWQALYVYFFGPQDIPEEPPCTEQMLMWIAQLGGYQGPRKNRSPGAQTIWIGMQRLADIAQMWLMMKKGRQWQ